MDGMILSELLNGTDLEELRNQITAVQEMKPYLVHGMFVLIPVETLAQFIPSDLDDDDVLFKTGPIFITRSAWDDFVDLGELDEEGNREILQMRFVDYLLRHLRGDFGFRQEDDPDGWAINRDAVSGSGGRIMSFYGHRLWIETWPGIKTTILKPEDY